jgi:hypothetical protein
MILSGLMAIPIDQQAALFIQHYGHSSSVAGVICHLLDVYSTVKVRHTDLSFGYGYDWLAVSHVFLGLLFMGIDMRFVRHMKIFEVGFFAYMVIIVVAIIQGIIKGMPVWWQVVNYAFGLAGFLLLWSYYHVSKKMHIRSSTDVSNE